MEEQKEKLHTDENEENGEQKVYGVRWLHFFYKIGMPARALSGLFLFLMGAGAGSTFGGCIAAFGAIYAVAAVYMFLSYWKSKWIGVYSKALYYVTLTVIWGEYAVSLIGFLLNPLLPIGATVFAICNTVYFYHRKYLFAV